MLDNASCLNIDMDEQWRPTIRKKHIFYHLFDSAFLWGHLSSYFTICTMVDLISSEFKAVNVPNEPF